MAACLSCDVAAAPSPQLSYEVGARPRSIAVGDLNADGRPDVVVANAGGGTVTVLLGLGDGRLGAPSPPIPAGNEPSDVEAVDLDNDSDLDLAVANHETPHVGVLLNDGRAAFRPAPGSPFDTGARPHVHGLASGDFDGDGWNDLAADSSGGKEVRLLRGSPRGLLRAVPIAAGAMPYFRLGAADVLGDGFLDILVPGHDDLTVRVVHRTGRSLTSTRLAVTLAEAPWMVVGDDFSGDRRVDLAVVHASGLSVWLRQGEGFAPAPGSPHAIPGATEVATGDLDGDGAADLAVGPWDGAEVTILDGGRSWKARRVRVCERPIGLAIADLDGDRRGELLAACATENRVVVVRRP